MKNRTRALIASATTALLTPLVLAGTTTYAAAATRSIIAVNANVGSGTVVGANFTGTPAANSPLGKAINKNATFLMLQEVCRSQFDWMQANTAYKGVFTPMTSGDETAQIGACSASDAKGQAVLSNRGILNPSGEVVSLQAPLRSNGVHTGKNFRLTCITVAEWGFRGSPSDPNRNADYLTGCTTHLWSAGRDRNGHLYSSAKNKAVRNGQAQRIAGFLNARSGSSGNHKVILTGDFNAIPKSGPIDKIHRVNQNGTVGSLGRFWEGDQSLLGSWGCSGSSTTLCRDGRGTLDAGTNSRKYDYMFGSFSGLDKHTGIKRHLVAQNVQVTGNPPAVPHHYMLDATFTWTDVVG